jgi:hypothetical protein
LNFTLVSAQDTIPCSSYGVLYDISKSSTQIHGSTISPHKNIKGKIVIVIFFTELGKIEGFNFKKINLTKNGKKNLNFYKNDKDCKFVYDYPKKIHFVYNFFKSYLHKKVKIKKNNIPPSCFKKTSITYLFNIN